MKSKQFFGILLLLVGTILSGCKNTPDYPYDMALCTNITST